MILHLLVLFLSLGAVELQAANTTQDVWRNQTFTNGNYTLIYTNGTFNLTEDERSQLENRIEGITANETSDVITEDDEHFQEQQTGAGRVCQRDQLEIQSQDICGHYFHQAMMLISPEKWCVLKNVIRPYNKMELCLNELSDYFGCFYPNPQIQDLLISIHKEYFHDCGQTETEDQDIIDLPEKIIVTLILVPVSLIPILVYMVVRNNKVQK